MSSEIKMFAELLGVSDAKAGIILIVVLVWSLYWKGRSMWLSAKHGDRIWFIILLLVNSMGILDMIYIYLLAKPGDPEYGTEEVKN